MTTIGVVIDQKCNIRCAHCCFASSPQSELHLSDDEVLRIVEGAARNINIDTIAISGGEALLRFPLILKCAQIAKSNNKKCTVMTNGFWGITSISADAKVRALQKAGISSLGFSVDDFHEAHIPISRIQNCLNACRENRMQCSIDMVVTKNHTGASLLEALGEAVLGVPIFRYPLQRVGRAVSIPSTDLFRPEDSSANLHCPGFQVTYHFDGKVYPCCSPSAFQETYSLGSTKEIDVNKALHTVQYNRLFSLMRKEGFGWLMDHARLDGVSGLPDPPYINACKVCNQLFSNAEFLKWLTTSETIKNEK